LVQRRALDQATTSYFNRHNVAVLVYPSVPVTARPTRGAGDSLIEINGTFAGTRATLTRNSDFAGAAVVVPCAGLASLAPPPRVVLPPATNRQPRTQTRTRTCTRARTLCARAPSPRPPRPTSAVFSCVTRCVALAACLGLPSVSVPAGLADHDPSTLLPLPVSATPRAPVTERPTRRPGADSERLPVGLEFTGLRGSDELVLGVAKAFQCLAPLLPDPVERARWAHGVNLF
jgi:hypothetical protein